MDIFTFRTFTLALEITFLLNKYFFLQVAYELLSESRKFNKWGRGGGGRELEHFKKKKQADAY